MLEMLKMKDASLECLSPQVDSTDISQIYIRRC